MRYELTELLPVVAWLTDKYTSKESGSVTYETANQLMGAVLYCIGELDGKSESADSTALIYGAERPDARTAYDTGYAAAFQKVVDAKNLYTSIMKHFCAFGCICYDDTVREGMPDFFARYDVRFLPQDHILTLDYPVLADLGQSCGVDRILRYLTCIKLEQSFLGRFPERFVRETAAAQNTEYKSMFDNISSMVLRHIEGCMLIGKPIQEPGFTDAEYDKIREVLAVMEPEGLECRLGQLLEALLNQGFQKKKELYRYLSADIPDFRAALLNAAEHNSLRAVL